MCCSIALSLSPSVVNLLLFVLRIFFAYEFPPVSTYFAPFLLSVAVEFNPLQQRVTFPPLWSHTLIEPLWLYAAETEMLL